MARLIVKKKAEILSVHTFENESSIVTVGSNLDNTIIIDDKRVSLTHFEVRSEPFGYVLRDLRSAFGTFLNGRRIEDIALLKSGDEINFGDHTIVFELQQESSSVVPPPAADENDHTVVAVDDRTVIATGNSSVSVDDDRTIVLMDELSHAQTDESKAAKIDESADDSDDERTRVILNEPPDIQADENKAAYMDESADDTDDERTIVMMDDSSDFQANEDKTVYADEPAEESDDERTVLMPAGLADEPDDESTRVLGESEEFETSQSEDVTPSQSLSDERMPEREAAHVPRYDLLSIYGPYKGKRYQLLTDKTRIGRDDLTNDIIINQKKSGEIDGTVSRRHATIAVKDGKYYLSDKRSKLRTYLNQHELTTEDDCELADGDEIEIVSSHTSTIFRFVPSGQIDFSPPHKAGVWWIRCRKIMDYALVALLLVCGLISISGALLKIPLLFGKVAALEMTTEIIDNYSTEKLMGGFGRSDPASIIVPTPAVNDMNGDGRRDIVCIDATGALVCYDVLAKSDIWRKQGEFQASFQYSIVVDDIDNNGDLELVVAGDNSRIYAFDSKSGLQEWVSDFLVAKVANTPTVADLNHDGIKDIIVSTQDGNLVTGLSSGSSYVWKSVPLDFPTRGIPSVADLDGDGTKEIAVGSENGKIVVLTAVENGLSPFKTIDVNEQLNQAFSSWGEDNSINNAVVLAPISNSTQKRKILVASTRHYRLIAFDANESKRRWAQKLVDPGRGWPMYHASPVAADLDGDGQWEVIVPSFGESMALSVYSIAGQPDGSPNILWQYNAEPRDGFVSSPALADVNKDGIIDVIASSVRGNIVLLDGKSGEKLGLYSEKNAVFTSSPLVCLLNDDLMLDIVAMDDNYNIHHLQLNSKMSSAETSWSQFLGNPDHSGQFKSQPASKLSFYISILAGLLLVCAAVFYLFRQIGGVRKLELSY